MEDLLRVALLGTAKQPAAPAEDHPADTLVARLPDLPAERGLLLRAGARTVYQAAGYVADRLDAPPEPAPAEGRPPCPARAAEILHLLFERKQPFLLHEALARLDQAGQRLPPELLPRALQETNAEVRGLLRPVLGQRGRWLAQFNDDWSWVTEEAPSATGELPAEAESLWREGSFAERKRLLQRLRALDPGRARQWLQDAWPREKAEQRAELLETFAAGLAKDDEPFLESILDDRSTKVQTIAAGLLARLPESALAARMRQRGEEMLSYTPAKPGCTRGTPQAGSLTFAFPRKFDPEWERDGIQEKPPAGVGPRTYWASQVLALVPPSHWETYFGAPAAELVAAAEAGEDAATLLDVWSGAALNFGLQDWIQTLWDAWSRRKPGKGRGTDRRNPADLLLRLLARMEPTAAEERLSRLLDHSAPVPLAPALAAVPRPWSVSLARTYLAGLRRQVADIACRQKAAFDEWYPTLEVAAPALPEECLGEALGPWELPDTNDYHVRSWREALDQFTDTVRTRKELLEQVRHVS